MRQNFFLSILFFLAIITIAVNSSLTKQANAATEKMFIPIEKRVPLSIFQECTASSCNLTFNVRPDLASWIQSKGGNIQLVSSTGSKITVSGWQDGNFTKKVGKGKYVATSSKVVNQIQRTHWKHTLGYDVNSTDAFYRIKCNLDTGETTLDFDPSAAGGLPFFFTPNGSSPYFYNTAQYPLVPGNWPFPNYERYIGENFSLTQMDDSLLICKSNETLTTMGWPTVYYSYPDINTTPLKEGLPAFQVISNYPIKFNSLGDDSSLATYILPPKWVKNPTIKYPIFFNGYYDLAWAYYGNGTAQHKMIADLIKNNYGSTIGVFWNNGGAAFAGYGGGSRSMQRSAYDNAWSTLNYAKTDLGADWSKIVTWGDSRGGGTALAVAGNPYTYSDNYTVRYAIAYVPATRIGDHLINIASHTYPGLFRVITEDSGFQYAWRSDWRAPFNNSLNGWQLLLFNYKGTIDAAIADNDSPWGQQQIDKLKEKGTKVVLSTGTHDSYIPFAHQADYAERLRAANVPIRHEVAYRLGHNGIGKKEDAAYNYMIQVLNGQYQLTEGTFYYVPDGFGGTTQLSDTNFTAILEAPKEGYHNTKLNYIVSGDAGSQWSVKLRNLLTNDEVLGIGSTGVFSATPSGIKSQMVTVSSVSADLLPSGDYYWTLEYLPNGQTEWLNAVNLARNPLSGPLDKATLKVNTSEPNNINGIQMADLELDNGTKGWGLSAK